jgi:hypothetical protein
MGYTNPAFILLVYSPGLVGMFMVWRHYGRPGLASFFGRLTLWRMSGGWWALLLLGMPAVFYAGAAVTGTLDDFPFDPWYGVLPALSAALLIGPIEELGWRGAAAAPASVRAALVVVWVNRKSMFTRGAGATGVLMRRADLAPAAAPVGDRA